MGRIRKVNRLKKAEEEFRAEHFYIVVVNNDTYQLRDVDSHYTISTANSLEGIVEYFRIILKRYKNYTILNRFLQGMSEKESNTKTLQRKSKEYKSQGKMYLSLVKEEIAKYHSSLESKKKRLKPSIPAPIEDTMERKPTPLVANRLKPTHNRRKFL